MLPHVLFLFRHIQLKDLSGQVHAGLKPFFLE
jgi:hypothetical protein